MKRPTPEIIGRWLDLPSANAGGRLQVLFTPDHKMVVRKVIPERVIEAIKERCQEDLAKKGTLVGNTQKHWLKVGSIPKPLHSHLERKLGPSQDPDAQKNWNRFWNTSGNPFRSSEHKL
jgi:hypothetical protein